MTDAFESCLPLVLRHEGGFANHPRDPGGATNRGVTQAVYDAYRSRSCTSRRSVAFINTNEVSAIYRRQYWEAAGCHRLPIGVDYAVFDYAVNSGVSRATKALQKILGVPADGVFGLVTDAAADQAPASVIISRLCNQRLGFVRSLKSLFVTFGRGWSRRIADVRAKALDMAA